MQKLTCIVYPFSSGRRETPEQAAEARARAAARKYSQKMNNATPNPTQDQFTSTSNPITNLKTTTVTHNANVTSLDNEDSVTGTHDSNEEDDDIFTEGDDGEIEVI